MDIFKATNNLFQNFFSKINELLREKEQVGVSAIASEIKVYEANPVMKNESALRAQLTNLNKENFFLYEIIKHAEEGFIVLDKDKKIKFINNCILKKIGAPGEPPDYIERDSLELIRFPNLYEGIDNLLKQQKTTQNIYLSCETTQTEFEIMLKLFDHDGETFILTKWHDITLYSKTEKAGKDLVANVAHQLRTPLTSIKGYAETLLDGAFDDPSVSKKFLETILRNADRLTNLVRDILTLSKLDNFNSLPKYQLINTTNLLNHVIEQLQHLAEEKSLTINNSYPEKDIFIMGSQPDLEIALHNLLDNAIKYSPQNSYIQIKIDQIDESAVISIKDQGRGIAQKDCEKIFERFYRIEEGKSKKMMGTGLGLAIVKQIVELHNGMTWVESLWGTGATFYFSIPVVKTEPTALLNLSPSIDSQNSANFH
jgi:two-component system phosphate regulon sensor histidine kinase PhoR